MTAIIFISKPFISARSTSTRVVLVSTLIGRSWAAEQRGSLRAQFCRRLSELQPQEGCAGFPGRQKGARPCSFSHDQLSCSGLLLHGAGQQTGRAPAGYHQALQHSSTKSQGLDCLYGVHRPGGTQCVPKTDCKEAAARGAGAGVTGRQAWREAASAAFSF